MNNSERQHVKFDVLVPLVHDIIVKRQFERGKLEKADESWRYNEAINDIEIVILKNRIHELEYAKGHGMIVGDAQMLRVNRRIERLERQIKERSHENIVRA